MSLYTAIDTGNLDKLQEILGIRDNNGIPLVNVNQGLSASVLHYIVFTNHQPELKRLMIQTVLDIRDNANNIVADLNLFHCNAGTVLTAAIDKNDLILIQQILDVRNHDGSLTVDLRGGVNPGHFWHPLTRALFLNRLEIVQFLIDARNADGTPFYSLVEMQTALEGAHANGVTDVAINVSTIWLIEHLREQGINPELLPDPIARIREEAINPELFPPAPIIRIREEAINPDLFLPAPIVRIPEEAINPELLIARIREEAINPELAPAPIAAIENNAFFNDIQNTHAPEVTISVESSVKKLLNRYKTEQNKIPEILLECENYILLCSSSEKKDALNCLKRIKNIDLKREPPGITLSHLLALVWKASEDKAAVVSGVEAPLNDKDIADRKKVLIDNLIAAQNTYGLGGEACFVGTFNKIIESLDQIHPDVTIMTGREMILPVATDRARALVKENLLEKNSLIEIKSILRTWHDSDSEDVKTKATQFRESIVPIIDKALKEEFKHLLTHQKRDEITSEFEYLPCPIVISKEFEQLVKIIEGISLDAKTETYEKIYISSHLKFLAKEIYAENDISFEALYEQLREKYEYFKKVESYERLRERYEYFKKIESIESIAQIKFQYKGNNEYHLAAIENINTAIKNYYFLLQLDKSEPFNTKAQQQLITNINGIRKAVYSNLKQHNILRFFPFGQPKSQLISLIDSALKKFDPDEEISKNCFTSNEKQNNLRT